MACEVRSSAEVPHHLRSDELRQLMRRSRLHAVASMGEPLARQLESAIVLRYFVEKTLLPRGILNRSGLG